MNRKLIENPHHALIHNLCNGLGLIIERGYGRENHNPHTREFQHAFKMDFVELTLTDDQHQPTAFFKGNDSGAENERITVTCCDGGWRSAPAATNYHAR